MAKVPRSVLGASARTVIFDSAARTAWRRRAMQLRHLTLYLNDDQIAALYADHAVIRAHRASTAHISWRVANAVLDVLPEKHVPDHCPHCGESYYSQSGTGTLGEYP